MCQFTDHFYAAVRRLAGDGAVKPRLLAAYTENLELLPDQDIPASIRENFDQLRRIMQSTKPINGEGPAAASVRKMSAAEATRYSKMIVAMFSELVRVEATGERLGNGKNGDKADNAPTGPQHATLN